MSNFQSLTLSPLITHAAAVRGKATIDLSTDPPPDVVIKIDITRSSLDKFPLYAAIGVPEVWHYTGDELTIVCLRDHAYITTEASALLPVLTAHHVTECRAVVSIRMCPKACCTRQ